jgi:hypothetical protein
VSRDANNAHLPKPQSLPGEETRNHCNDEPCSLSNCVGSIIEGFKFGCGRPGTDSRSIHPAAYFVLHSSMDGRGSPTTKCTRILRLHLSRVLAVFSFSHFPCLSLHHDSSSVRRWQISLSDGRRKSHLLPQRQMIELICETPNEQYLRSTYLGYGRHLPCRWVP